MKIYFNYIRFLFRILQSLNLKYSLDSVSVEFFVLKSSILHFSKVSRTFAFAGAPCFPDF